MKPLTPHKHANEIRAFADGYQIQRRQANDPRAMWLDTKYPDFDEDGEFRVKPEPAQFVSSLSDAELLTAFSMPDIGANHPAIAQMAAEHLRSVAETAIARHLQDNAPAPGEMPPAVHQVVKSQITPTDAQDMLMAESNIGAITYELGSNGLAKLVLEYLECGQERHPFIILMNAAIARAIADRQVIPAAEVKSVLAASKGAVVGNLPPAACQLETILTVLRKET